MQFKHNQSIVQNTIQSTERRSLYNHAIEVFIKLKRSSKYQLSGL